MAGATVFHRFVTDANPIQVEWIAITADSAQDNPDGSVKSHLINPLRAVLLPANQDRGGTPSGASVALRQGSPELTLHDLESDQEIMVIVIGFGSVDYTEKYRPEGTGRES